jgi:hypothetical protein
MSQNIEGKIRPDPSEETGIGKLGNQPQSQPDKVPLPSFLKEQLDPAERKYIDDTIEKIENRGVVVKDRDSLFWKLLDLREKSIPTYTSGGGGSNTQFSCFINPDGSFGSAEKWINGNRVLSSGVQIEIEDGKFLVGNEL